MRDHHGLFYLWEQQLSYKIVPCQVHSESGSGSTTSINIYKNKRAARAWCTTYPYYCTGTGFADRRRRRGQVWAKIKSSEAEPGM